MKGGEKIKGNQIWTIVGVSLVVAIIASVATASITGNVIKLNQDKYGSYQVYTKAEVDTMIKSIPSGGTPKNCMVHSFASAAVDNGNLACSQWTKNKCLIGELILTATTNKTTSSGYPELVTVYPRFFKCSDSFNGVYNKTIPGIITNKEFQVICCD